MDVDDFFPNRRVVIIGLGLMGGSLALALRGRVARLWGVDQDPQVVKQALAGEVVEQAACRIEDLGVAADTIILAAPVRAILSELVHLSQVYFDPAVVIDLGSTKRAVIAAMAELPARFDPIGAHPMCGKERGGLENADPGLFQGATLALVRLTRTSGQAVQVAGALTHTIGAIPVMLDADTHDRWAASVSHVPYLIANALAASIPPEARPLVGPGLRSTTRLAPSNPGMMIDILMTNRDHVLASLHTFRAGLDKLETAIVDSDPDRLAALMAAGAESYHRLID